MSELCHILSEYNMLPSGRRLRLFRAKQKAMTFSSFIPISIQFINPIIYKSQVIKIINTSLLYFEWLYPFHDFSCLKNVIKQ